VDRIWSSSIAVTSMEKCCSWNKAISPGYIPTDLPPSTDASCSLSRVLWRSYMQSDRSNTDSSWRTHVYTIYTLLKLPISCKHHYLPH
jgi:hypothetical protein